MSQLRYKIVFNGELMPDAVLSSVKENLARLFKGDPARIDSLFSGAPIALKRDLAEHEAEQYLNALRKAGANVRKEPDQAAALSLVPTEEHADPAPAETSSPRMTCPKCAHEQNKAQECSACGVIIDKFLARQAQLAEQEPSPAAAAPSSPYAPPQANVAESLPQFGELKVFGISGRIGRVRYLGWSMAMLLCLLPLLLLGVGVIAVAEPLGILLTVLLGLAAMVLSLCFGVQRLHDIGWSGWLWLVNFVPFVGSVFALLMLIIPGTQGVNRFGPPPPPNSGAVKLLAWLILLVPIGGIVAAIALPAYQNYAERAL